VYYDSPHAFTADEVQLAELVAHEVAVGADRIRAEAAVGQLRELLEHERARRGDAERAHHTAEAANVAKSEFLSMLGHELRNPLNALVNAARVIAALTPDAAPTRAHEVLERQVTHLARLLDDLLDEARISQGLVSIRPTLVDLRTPTRFAVEEFAHRIAADAYDFSLVLPEDPIMVHGDAARLRQVVSNLLDNAIQSTPPQGSIRVALTADRGVALLRIRDTGRGIPADRLVVIFQPFVQGVQDLARSTGGLGLGLSLVRRILELHGGTVRAESDGPGTGAEFLVRIPLAPTSAPR
jgi:signal transduction histidine kinase